jgi:hypothetical protein
MGRIAAIRMNQSSRIFLLNLPFISAVAFSSRGGALE